MRQAISALPPHVPLARLIRAIALSNDSRDNALRIAEQWPDSPEDGLAIKSEVQPIDSQVASTGALSSYGFSSQIIETARALSIIGTLSSRITRVTIRTLFRKETT